MLNWVAVLIVLFGTLAGCNRTPYNEAEAHSTTVASMSPMPTLPQQPTYLAADYDKPGQPALTPPERALIEKTLAVIKPCQRELLRYAFPERADPDNQLVLFFAKPGAPTFDAHALWQGNLVYNEGNVGAVPDPIPSDIRNDIAETPCSNGQTFPEERRAPPIVPPSPLTSPEPTSAAFGSFRVLHRFSGGGDGSGPSGVILANGQLYGTSSFGGGGGTRNTCRKIGCGTVFTSTLGGRERVIYAFKGTPDGVRPSGGLLALNDEFYGTTRYGGTHQDGTVYAVSRTGRESVIYSFKGGEDGSQPFGDLVAVGGRLLGTTMKGGANDDGTVFEIDGAAERVSHSFNGSDDGSSPMGGLVAFNGALFGTATRGGPFDGGTIFRITSDGRFKTVYAFNRRTEEVFPGALTAAGGAIYGATLYGYNPGGGQGSIFKFTRDGYVDRLYAFVPHSDRDGVNPSMSPLTFVDGKLYGGTANGGIDDAGTLFVTTTAGRTSVLRYFVRDIDGGNPSSRLVLVGSTLYGTLGSGGSRSQSDDPGCCGTLFALTLR